ncbi:hypothetical protein CL658_04580 [bacterium]|nr:hypothetical protein [bacterium]
MDTPPAQESAGRTADNPAYQPVVTGVPESGRNRIQRDIIHCSRSRSMLYGAIIGMLFNRATNALGTGHYSDLGASVLGAIGGYCCCCGDDAICTITITD